MTSVCTISLSRLHGDIYWMPLAWLRSSHRVSVTNERLYVEGLPVREFDQEHKLTFRLIDLFFERIEHGRGEKRIELRSMKPQHAAARRPPEADYRLLHGRKSDVCSEHRLCAN